MPTLKDEKRRVPKGNRAERKKESLKKVRPAVFPEIGSVVDSLLWGEDGGSW